MALGKPLPWLLRKSVPISKVASDNEERTPRKTGIPKMIVRDEHLERFVNKGDEFEGLIHNLVCVEAWICKISPNQMCPRCKEA
jgi:hypothetical protein